MEEDCGSPGSVRCVCVCVWIHAYVLAPSLTKSYYQDLDMLWKLSECSRRERELHTEDQPSFLFLTTPLMSFPSITLRIFINPSTLVPPRPLWSFVSIFFSHCLLRWKHMNFETWIGLHWSAASPRLTVAVRAQNGASGVWWNRIDGSRR